jgi:hypothetical protein
MVIFHSYVKLPEGNDPSFLVESHHPSTCSPHHEEVPTDGETLEGGWASDDRMPWQLHEKNSSEYIDSDEDTESV